MVSSNSERFQKGFGFVGFTARFCQVGSRAACGPPCCRGRKLSVGDDVGDGTTSLKEQGGAADVLRVILAETGLGTAGAPPF